METSAFSIRYHFDQCLPGKSCGIRYVSLVISYFVKFRPKSNMAVSMIAQAGECQTGFHLLKNTLSLVLTDKGFDIPSERAQKGRLCAEKLLEWIRNNEDDACAFYSYLLKSLQSCCSHSRAVKFHTLKERIWENYYKYRSSEEFKNKWSSFIENIGFQSNAILYQNLHQS